VSTNAGFDRIDAERAVSDAIRGVRKLMVEGGSTMHMQFHTAGLAGDALCDRAGGP
jgi:riboflavin biosynthesis pyrimidine reductase